MGVEGPTVVCSNIGNKREIGPRRVSSVMDKPEPLMTNPAVRKVSPLSNGLGDAYDSVIFLGND